MSFIKTGNFNKRFPWGRGKIIQYFIFSEVGKCFKILCLRFELFLVAIFEYKYRFINQLQISKLQIYGIGVNLLKKLIFLG